MATRTRLCFLLSPKGDINKISYIGRFRALRNLIGNAELENGSNLPFLKLVPGIPPNMRTGNGSKKDR